MDLSEHMQISCTFSERETLHEEHSSYDIKCVLDAIKKRIKMYLPKHFEETNREKLAELIQQFPLATLILKSGDELEVNHIPLDLDMNLGKFGVLKGHIARQNPMVNLIQSSMDVWGLFHAEQH